MTRICYSLSDYAAPGLFRCFYPCNYCAPILKEEGIELVLADELRSTDDYDVCVFHRCPTQRVFSLINNLKSAGKTICLQTDDLVSNIPHWNQNGWYYKADDVKRFVEFCELADWIIVSTEELQRRLGHKEKTLVGPNLIDLSKSVWKEMEEEEEVRIVWAGSHTHGEDLDILVDGVRRIVAEHDNVRFLFVGSMPARLHPWPSCYYIPDVQLSEYYPRLVSLKPHIMLAPLAPHPFNDCKSPLKVLEAGGVCAACLASDSPAYQDTAAWLTDDWYKDLKELIGNFRLRCNLARSVREDVEENHSWNEAGTKKWLDVFRRICV